MHLIWWFSQRNPPMRFSIGPPCLMEGKPITHGILLNGCQQNLAFDSDLRAIDVSGSWCPSIRFISSLLRLMIFETNSDARCYPEFALNLQDCKYHSSQHLWLLVCTIILQLIYTAECMMRAYAERSNYASPNWILQRFHFFPKGAQLFASFFGGLVSLRFIPGPNLNLCVRTASGLEQMESSWPLDCHYGMGRCGPIVVSESEYLEETLWALGGTCIGNEEAASWVQECQTRWLQTFLRSNRSY